MVVETFKYKNFEVELLYFQETRQFMAKSASIKSALSNTADGACSSIMFEIDEFLKSTPKDFEELAQEIHNMLVWTSYEDCYVDSQIIEVLVKNFLKVYKLH